MYSQYGGILPVYVGSRYQRGGGILSSIARFVMPTAKKLLKETVKAAPSVVDSIINRQQSPGAAILRGLKTAGKNTAVDTYNRVMSRDVSRQMNRSKKRKQNLKNITRRTKRQRPDDIFS